MSSVNYRGNNNVTNASGFVQMFYLLNPTNRGSQTVSVTCQLTSGPTACYWHANTVSLTGVGSYSTGVGTYGSSTNPTHSSVTCGAGNMIVSALGTNNVAVSSPNQTSRWVQSGTSNIESGYIQTAGDAASITFSMTANTAEWAGYALRFDHA
jgi:hypothetical protein